MISMRSLVVAIALLFATPSRGDSVVQRWIEPRQVKWTGTHWEEHGERYFVLVYITETGQRRYEMWEVDVMTWWMLEKPYWEGDE